MKAEEKVRKFYEGAGWQSEDGNTTDAVLFEDLRPCAQDYLTACRRKILNFLPQSGDLILDAASGPIQYPEYLEYSAHFKKRVCVDISQIALDQAKNKLGEKGDYFCTSILEMPFEKNHFDAVLSLHTIYHIDKDEQEASVRKLLKVAKPNSPVVVIYSNPDRLLARLKRLVSKKPHDLSQEPLYFYAHPLEWWKRFEDQAHVEIHSWRTLTAKDAHRFIPNNILGKFALKVALKLEGIFDQTATSWGAYPLILLRKR